MTAQPVDLISLNEKVERGFSGIEQILSKFLHVYFVFLSLIKDKCPIKYQLFSYVDHIFFFN